MMARMKGTYLPVPPEWRDRGKGKSVTVAKAIALGAQLTSIPLEELLAMDEALRHPSGSTRKRLKKDLPVECGRLIPCAVSTLFQPEVYAVPTCMDSSHG
jgi:hypothetical protein